VQTCRVNKQVQAKGQQKIIYVFSVHFTKDLLQKRYKQALIR